MFSNETAFMHIAYQPSPKLPPPELDICNELMMLSEQSLSALSLQSTRCAPGFDRPLKTFSPIASL